MVSAVFMRIISAICLIGQVLSIAAFIFTYSFGATYSFKITWSVLNKTTCTININWYHAITMIAFSAASIGFFIWEIFLLISPTKFGFLTSGLTRVVFYLFSGISVLGVGADLGIFAGGFLLIGGALNLVVWLLFKLQCVVVDSSTLSQPLQQQKAA